MIPPYPAAKPLDQGRGQVRDDADAQGAAQDPPASISVSGAVPSERMWLAGIVVLPVLAFNLYVVYLALPLLGVEAGAESVRPMMLTLVAGMGTSILMSFGLVACITAAQFARGRARVLCYVAVPFLFTPSYLCRLYLAFASQYCGFNYGY